MPRQIPWADRLCAQYRKMPKGRVVPGCDENRGVTYFILAFPIKGYSVYLELVRGPGERLWHLVFVLDPRQRALVDRLVFEFWYDADQQGGFGGRFGNVRDLKRCIEECPAAVEELCKEFLERFMERVKADPRGFVRRAEVLAPSSPSRSVWAVSGGLPGLGKRA